MSKTDELVHVRGEIRAEITLLNSRLNALISSQSFLVIAYGSVLSAAFGEWDGPFTLTMPPFLALLGAALVIEAKPALKAAEQAIRHWRDREEVLIDRHSELRPYSLGLDEDSRRQTEMRQHDGRIFSSRAGHPAGRLGSFLHLPLRPLLLGVRLAGLCRTRLFSLSPAFGR